MQTECPLSGFLQSAIIYESQDSLSMCRKAMKTIC